MIRLPFFIGLPHRLWCQGDMISELIFRVYFGDLGIELFFIWGSLFCFSGGWLNLNWCREVISFLMVGVGDCVSVRILG